MEHGETVAETKNIDEIAGRLSKDIFKHFLWATHPKTEENFECANEKHLGEGGKPKATHPGDVVFHYRDPYLGKTVYLHTDLKSYAEDTITSTRLQLRFLLRPLVLSLFKVKEFKSSLDLD